MTAVSCEKQREKESNNSEETNDHKKASEDEGNDDVPDNHSILIQGEDEESGQRCDVLIAL